MMVEYQHFDMVTDFCNFLKQLIAIEEEHYLKDIEINKDTLISDEGYAWTTFPSWKAILELHSKDKDTERLLYFLLQLMSRNHILTKNEYIIEKKLESSNQSQIDDALDTTIQSAQLLISMQERFPSIQSRTDTTIHTDTILNKDDLLSIIQSLITSLEHIKECTSTLERLQADNVRETFEKWINSSNTQIDDLHNMISSIQSNNMELYGDIQSIVTTIDQLRYIYGTIDDAEITNELQSFTALLKERGILISQINNDLNFYREKEHQLYKTFFKILYISFPSMIDSISNQLSKHREDYSKVSEILQVFQFNMNTSHPISNIVNDTNLLYRGALELIDRLDSVNTASNSLSNIDPQYSIPQVIQPHYYLSNFY